MLHESLFYPQNNFCQVSSIEVIVHRCGIKTRNLRRQKKSFYTNTVVGVPVVSFQNSFAIEYGRCNVKFKEKSFSELLSRLIGTKFQFVYTKQDLFDTA